MDESIEASPHKESRHRLHRLNHKKNRVTSLDFNEIASRRKELPKPLYENCDLVAVPPDLNFSTNIFHEQLLLANAERMECMGTTQRASASLFTAGHGFQNGVDLQGLADIDAEDITESELLNICDAAENSLVNESFRKCAKTPPPPASTSKSIVELILEDFCSSPSSPELTPTKKLPRTPPFIFNRKNVRRTYARRRMPDLENVADNELLEERNENPSNTETACEPETGEPVVFVKSQRICANLLNLSDFFQSEDPMNCTLIAPAADANLPSTQASGDMYLTAMETHKDSEDFCDCAALLVEDIVSYRQKYPYTLSVSKRRLSNESEEFYGFSYGEENDGNDILPPDNVENPFDSKCGDRDSDVSANSWFEQDSELFVNIDTTTLDAKTNTLSSPKSVGFQTASNKQIKLSKKAQERAAQILEHLPELKEHSKKTKKEYPTSDAGVGTNTALETSALTTTTITPQFIGFQTASKKGIKLSKEAQERAAKILESLPELKEKSKKTNEAYPISMPSTLPNPGVVALSTTTNTTQFIGFQTASNKGIKLSKEAQERAERILESLPDLQEHSKKTKETYPTINTACEASSTTTTPQYIGFQTASKKGIQLSKEAEQRAAKILESLPQLKEKSKKTKEVYPTYDEKPSTSKAIRVHADNVVLDDDYDNIQLSEWFIGNHSEEKTDTAKQQTSTKPLEDIVNTDIFLNIKDETKRKASEILQHVPDPVMQFQRNGIDITPKRQCMQPKTDVRPDTTEIAPAITELSEWPAKAVECNDENSAATPTITCSTPINRPYASQSSSLSHWENCTPLLPIALTQSIKTKRNNLSLSKRIRRPCRSVISDMPHNAIACDNNHNVFIEKPTQLNKTEEVTTPKPINECVEVHGTSEPLTPLRLKNNCRFSGLRRRRRRLLTEASGE